MAFDFRSISFVEAPTFSIESIIGSNGGETNPTYPLPPTPESSCSSLSSGDEEVDVVDVKVAPGETVEKGQVVAVLSAMKMEMAVQVRE